MPKWLTDFLESSKGKVVGVAFAVLAILVGGYFIYDALLGQNEAELASTDRIYIDAETGKTFGHTLTVGEKMPVLAPSGKNTGYPAEACYWTKDGKSKDKPTYILVNQAMGKPDPTFCSDCGRLVVPLNPAPGQDVKAPPTEAEFKARRTR